MAHHYGPEWRGWLPLPVIAEHWSRFPVPFGSGPEAVFLSWMNLRYGAGWQSWVPTPVVRMNWILLFG